MTWTSTRTFLLPARLQEDYSKYFFDWHLELNLRTTLAYQVPTFRWPKAAPAPKSSSSVFQRTVDELANRRAAASMGPWRQRPPASPPTCPACALALLCTCSSATCPAYPFVVHLALQVLSCILLCIFVGVHLALRVLSCILLCMSCRVSCSVRSLALIGCAIRLAMLPEEPFAMLSGTRILMSEQ